ncbi:hypothetical protein EJB05_56761, partial [Eragrostis curvula]
MDFIIADLVMLVARLLRGSGCWSGYAAIAIFRRLLEKAITQEDGNDVEARVARCLRSSRRGTHRTGTKKMRLDEDQMDANHTRSLFDEAGFNRSARLNLATCSIRLRRLAL